MKEKKAVSLETFVFIGVILIVFGYVQSIMGIGNMFSTIMNTAHTLLLEVVFYIMAVAVLAGALSALCSEFGVIALLNKIISPVMQPLYGLPGAASLGIVTTFVSDNPAILSLANHKGFSKYFKDYQFPALCNLGTSFGMGLILVTFMMGLGDGSEFIAPTMIGVLGAVIGSIVSVRLMMRSTKKYYGVTKEQIKADKITAKEEKKKNIEVRVVETSYFKRIINAILEGGKTGVKMGLDIIPGVLIICTAVMILTFGPADVQNGVAVYTGSAYEGIGLLNRIGVYILPPAKLLFGFTDVSNITFPITSLGATGAAMGLVPTMIKNGVAGGQQIAVFTAMGMCWSGYLSTHVSMMDALEKRHFITPAILSHTVGGLCAGIAANYLYQLFFILL